MPGFPKLLVTVSLLLALSGCGEEASAPTTSNNAEASSAQSVQAPTTESTNSEPAVHSDNPETNGESSSQTTPSDEADRYANIELTIGAIREATFDGGSTVEIRFSAPLDRSRDLTDFIRVNNQRASGGIGWLFSEDGKSLFMTGAVPETTYKINVSPGLMAASGKQLGQSYADTVTTAAAPPVLSFASDGHVLVPGSEQGLPVITRNIKEANVTFMRVNDNQIASVLDLLGNGTRSSNYYLQTVSKHAELAYEGRFELTSDDNRRRQVNLPINHIKELQLPGMYVAVMDQPANFEYEHPTTWFTVTDLGLHLRQYDHGAELFVQSLATTKAVAGARIERMTGNGSRTNIGSTDKEGRFHLRSRLNSQDILIVRKDESVSILPLNTTALDLSAFHYSQRPYRVQNLFIYSPRDLYRGGETAQFSALLRGDDGQPVKAVPLRAEIIRPDAQKATEISLKPQADGYYEWQYAIADDAMTGTWRVEVDLPDRSTATYRFKVEDFMPERMKLSWRPAGPTTGTAEADNRHTGADDLQIPVLGEYLYGAPAAGNRLDVSVAVRPEPHPFEGWKDYWFGNTNLRQWNSHSQQELAMDEQGKATVSVENQWPQATIPMAVELTGSLFESGGRPVIRRTKEVWLPGKQLLGIKPAFTDHAPQDGLADFDIVLTDGTEQLFDRTSVNVSLMNVTPRYHWRYSSSRGWYDEREEQSVKELSMTIDLNSKAPLRLQVPVGWGEYQLLLTDPDTGLQAMVPFKAGDRSYWWRSGSESDSAQPQQVTLAWDKKGYRSNDVAVLNITPPAAIEQLPQASYDALVMVEGDDLKFFKRVSLPKTGGTVDIPIDPGWTQHNLYASVLYLQPSDNQQRITPTRAVGLIHLPLNRADRALEINLNAPEKWLPNRTVNVDLTVTDSSGKAVSSAWVTLAAVDVGVLSVSGFETPQPFDFFFAPRRYQADQYDLYHQLIDFNNSKPATLKFGGDAAMARGGDMARSQVQIVSLYSGRVNVVNGKASIPLALPDFNGRVRLMAVAFDSQRVGHADAEVTIAAPLVTQMSLPRFAGINDQSHIALDLTNLSGETATLTLQAKASGPVEFDAVNRTIELAQQQKTTVTLPFTATLPAKGSLGHIDFHVTVDGIDDYPVDRHWQLVSRPTLAAVTQRYRDRLSAGESLTMDADEFTQLAAAGLKGELILDSRVNLNPAHQLDELLHYPYGCLEQSVSSSWPWLFVPQQQIDDLNQRRNRQFKREQALTDGLNRIYKRQLSNGGFTLWSLSDDYEQHWLTAYAADFLTDAREQGYPINNYVLERAIQRMQKYVRGRGDNRERWSDDRDSYRFAYRSYAAYVLARHRQVTLADIRKLASGAPDSATPLSLVQLAEAARLMGDQRKADELLQTAQQHQRGQRYLGDYGSPLRDKAAIVNLLGQAKTANAWRDDLLFELEADLRNRRWLSTQERIQLLQASNQQDQNGTPWQVSMTMQQLPQAVIDSGAYQPDILSGSRQQRMPLNSQQLGWLPAVTNTGEESVSAEFMVQGYLQNNAPVNQGGVTIQRRYFKPDGTPLAFDNDQLTLKTGDRVLVELQVSSKKYRPDLMAVDLLPAGLELENENLANGSAGAIDKVLIDSTPISEWKADSPLLHREFRDDRFVAALATGSRYDNGRDRARLYYVARAVTPGQYRIPGPLLEDMYDPEARAIGISTQTMVIEP